MPNKKNTIVKIKKTDAFGWIEDCENIVSLEFMPKEDLEFIIKTPHPKNKLYLIKINPTDGTATIEPYKKSK